MSAPNGAAFTRPFALTAALTRPMAALTRPSAALLTPLPLRVLQSFHACTTIVLRRRAVSHSCVHAAALSCICRRRLVLARDRGPLVSVLHPCSLTPPSPTLCTSS
ncbi:hypothetical protein DENSPDRAFT_885005 [Dentipellis sp. KUC8613]|nr:hypothetical protein DENSPDRAFT_885003 [Dentipellis sp. KUC8613]KAA1477328.1 hypothetical protein DENSPDRAFT_885005 [Dentipellis sp. KUC8613]